MQGSGSTKGLSLLLVAQGPVPELVLLMVMVMVVMVLMVMVMEVMMVVKVMKKSTIPEL